MRLSRTIVASLSALALGAAPLFGQETNPNTTSLDAFVAAHGDGWKSVADSVTGNTAFVYGGRFSIGVVPRTDAQYEAAARMVVNENFALFGFGAESLELREVTRLALGAVGSSDKVAVVFDQVVDGVPVLSGAVTILFDAKSGHVLALDSTGVPYAQNVALVPGSSTNDALAAAEAAYAAHFHVAAASVDAIDVAIVGPSAFFGAKNPLTRMGPTLAYVVELSTPGIFTEERVPAQARVYVSAEGDLTTFKVQPTAHAASGQVQGNVNTGQEPNTPTNQETPALQNLWVRLNNQTGQIVATTDAAGNYNTGSASTQTLHFRLQGPYCNVINDGGTAASFTISASGAGNNVLFNPTKTEFPTGEVAGFYWVNVFRQWVVGVDPTDTTMNFSVQTEVNKNDFTCNAYYDGNSINLEQAAGSCTNTAYSDVILHEEGHYANERYNGGAGMSGAFHEGNADAWAYFMNDDPCLETFSGVGCLRNALQTLVKKCPTDGDESCNGGEVHQEGKAIASALWAVRANLDVTHGNAAGDAIANTLFSAWMRTFNDKTIVNVIQDHWIALDDDDGNLSNGTPNSGDINAGFVSYGWPAPPDLSITINASPADNSAFADNQTAQVVATITSVLGTVTIARVHYALDGQSFTTVGMTPTGNPNQYAATIPGFVSPNRVRWYVSATSSAGNSLTVPSAAPEYYRLYHVGQLVVYNSFNFDGATDEGWTHVNLSGTNGDQWNRANPAGSNASTDPGAAFSVPNVWGTDLSVTGFDGMYEPNSSGELRSPTFNFSGQSKVYLQYRRWLAVEDSSFDQADIRVNNVLVWQNPTTGNLIDTEWVLHDIDVSAQAAGGAATQVSYRMTSDGGVEFGGWNIDDFMMYRVDPNSVCGSISSYGTPEIGSTGTPGVMTTLGGNPQVGNPSFAVAATGLKPNQFAVLFAGDSVGNNVQAWGTILVGAPNFTRTYSTTDGTGAVSIVIPILPAMAGTTRYFQFAARDQGFGGNVQACDALMITFCP